MEDFDDGQWTASLFFLQREGHPVLAEVRIHPKETNARPGEWERTVSAVPRGGLTATTLRAVRLGELRGRAIGLMEEPSHPFWGQDPEAAFDEYWDAVHAAGIRRLDITQEVPTPGREEHTPELLAVTAYLYVEALRRGARPYADYIIEHISSHAAQIPDPAIKTLTQGKVKTWKYKAVERGYLTGSPGKGVPGGSLTPRAISVLHRLGIGTPSTDEEDSR